jgi:hypothetical protein
MAWIESHTTLEKHPKTVLLRRRMRWSQNETVGFLHRFWWLVLDYAPTGLVSALTAEVMAESMGMDSGTFDRAMSEMEQAGFLRRTADGILVNDWIEYAGTYLRTIKFRRSPEKWRETERLYSVGKVASGKGLSGDMPPEKPPAARDLSPDTSSDKSGDKSRLPNRTDQPNQPHRPTPPAKGVVPPEDLVEPWMQAASIPHMRNRAFVTAYGEWLQTLRDRQRDPSVITVRHQLNWLAGMTLERAIEVVHHSIRTGYAKLTEPDGKAGGVGGKRAQDKQEFDAFIDGLAEATTGKVTTEAP